MAKRRLIIFALIALLFILLFFNLTSALTLGSASFEKSYTTETETWTYIEDVHGHNRGFKLTHSWKSPKYEYHTSYNSLDFIDLQDRDNHYNSRYNRYSLGYGRYSRSKDYDYLDSAMRTYSLNKYRRYDGSYYSRYSGYYRISRPRYYRYSYSYPRYSYGYY